MAISKQTLIETLKSVSKDWSEWMNFKKYPIQERQSPAYDALVAKCQADMKRVGACELPDFVTLKALEFLQAESVFLESDAFFKPVVANAYLKPGDDSLPGDHPLNLTEPTRVGVVAYDQFPEISLLKQIYEYQPLMRFVGDILDLKDIYLYGDSMGGLNLSVMQTNDYLRWHFDQTDFVTSLAIQSAESGGNFEYVPMIRSHEHENYTDVKRVLDGDRSRVIHLANTPGTLVLFQGRYSIHRVTPIVGARPRWIGLFGFDSKEHVESTPHLREMRYGRQSVLKTRPKFEDLKPS
jgi:hypothetical protein